MVQTQENKKNYAKMPSNPAYQQTSKPSHAKSCKRCESQALTGLQQGALRRLWQLQSFLHLCLKT